MKRDTGYNSEITAVVGTQWGDEGKGRMVDLLAQDADAVIRYQGGGNAGHTIINENGKFVSHLLPSGVFTKGTINILGTGMVIDPAMLVEEIQSVKDRIPDMGNVIVSDRAHVVLSLHKKIEAGLDNRKDSLKYGSTKRGIAQAYQFKSAKIGLQFSDLISGEDHLIQRLKPIVAYANILFRGMEQEETTVEEIVSELVPHIEKIAPLVQNIVPVIQKLLQKESKILVEGQLGSLRDLDWGIYPYTTSSNTLAGFATVGAALPPNSIDNVLGITKAYSSCVGTGPFVTELLDETGDKIREVAGEFGATTGRPRRIGWFDAVATRHGANVQGATSLCVTLLDVLSSLDKIYACESYEVDGERINDFPTFEKLNRAKPVLKEFKAWHTDITNIRKFEDLPTEAQEYVKWIEEQAGVPVTHISVGPKRDQIIYV